MHVLEKIREQARANPKRVVLPEGGDRRVVSAASEIMKEGIAGVVILGEPDEVGDVAGEIGVDISGAEIINPLTSPYLQDFAAKYYELRKNKGLTEEEAYEQIKHPLFFGAMMVREGFVDGMVGGAVNTSADVMRAALRIVGLREGNRTLSASCIIIIPDCPYGEDGQFLFADISVVPRPAVEQLADIAISTAWMARNLLGWDPRVAMLSFSTKGSASHDEVDRVVKATEIIKAKAPELLVDGEMQLDAAVVKEIGEFKAPGSPVAGRANVLIFPDLNSGNIGYKMAQRLAGGEAIGPLLQGTAKPVNDLSRGCSSEDIVNVAAITVVEAQAEGDCQ